MNSYTDAELLCQTVDLTDQEWHELISRGSVKRQPAGEIVELKPLTGESLDQTLSRYAIRWHFETLDDLKDFIAGCGYLFSYQPAEQPERLFVAFDWDWLAAHPKTR